MCFDYLLLIRLVCDCYFWLASTYNDVFEAIFWGPLPKRYVGWLYSWAANGSNCYAL